MARPMNLLKKHRPVWISAAMHATVLLFLAAWGASDKTRTAERVELTVRVSQKEDVIDLLLIATELRESEDTKVENEVRLQPVEVLRPAVLTDRRTLPASLTGVMEWDLKLNETCSGSSIQAGHATGAVNAGTARSQRRGNNGNGRHGSWPAHCVSFFGSMVQGQSVVMVLDRSQSMKGRRMEKLKAELERTLGLLPESMLFNVLFFNDRVHESDAGGLRAATQSNKAKMMQWVSTISAARGTEPEPALARAIELEPDVVLFLTDGTFHFHVVVNVTRMNENKIPIFTFGLDAFGGSDVLTRLASESGGIYTLIR